jgi:hypothetical protein
MISAQSALDKFYFGIKTVLPQPVAAWCALVGTQHGGDKIKKEHGRSMWQLWEERRGACMVLVGKETAWKT